MPWGCCFCPGVAACPTSIRVKNGKSAKSHVQFRHLYMRKVADSQIRTYILGIYACENWQARQNACTIPASVHAKSGRLANPHIQFRHLYMRKMAGAEIRTYILGIYACENWQAHQNARTLSASAHTGTNKRAKAHVQFRRLYMRIVPTSPRHM